MEIIDAHHHLWERGRFRYSWLRGFPALDRDYLLHDFEQVARECGVARSVFVQADTDPAFGLQETKWALSLAQAGPTIAGVVGWAPVGADDLEDFLEKLGTHPLLKGVRRLIQGEPDPDFCTRPGFVAGVRCLAQRGLSFDLCVYHRQLPAVIRLVRQVPEASFVLDHAGKPGIATGQIEPWKSHIRELAGLENVVCKVSGMVTEAEWGTWKAADLRPYLEQVVQAFGFGRVMFGSDWPVSTLAADYRRWLETVQEAVRDATSREQEQLFSGTATRFYRL